jgi:type IV pilus assembly protein PilA
MLARIRKAREEREGGFTLIELLVVVIIIGILAAIAIPVFLNQRKKGIDAQLQSDLRNAATAEETYLTDYNVYGSSVANLNTEGFHASSSDTGFTVVGTNGSSSYCLKADSGSVSSDGPYYFASSTGAITKNVCTTG